MECFFSVLIDYHRGRLLNSNQDAIPIVRHLGRIRGSHESCDYRIGTALSDICQ
jgi:hypothetical protein